MKQKLGIKTYDLESESVGNHYNCIYCYVNKVNGKKYVGQAKDLIRRHKGHIYSKNNQNDRGYNFPIHKALRKYGEESFFLVIIEENIETKNELDQKEVEFIEKMNAYAKDEKGYNVATGGNGGWLLEGKTEKEIEEWKRKVRENTPRFKGEEHGMYGKHHTEETKRKLSETLSGENNPFYGKKHTEETLQKIKESQTIYRGKDHPNAKKIKQYTLEGVFIREWDYIGEASKNLCLSEGAISQSCTTKKKRAGNYQWRYSEECPTNDNIKPYQKFNHKRPNPKCRKSVVQLDLNGNYIKTWEAASIAGKALDIKPCSITLCCQKKYKQAKGFIWRYASEYFEEGVEQIV